MPSATDFIQEGITALGDVLRSSPDFMSPRAANPPEDAGGAILEVQESDAFRPDESQEDDVYAGIFFAGLARASRADGAGQREYDADFRIEVFGGGTPGETAMGRRGRPLLWERCNRMIGVLPKLVDAEVGPDGGKFGGYSYLASVESITPRETFDDDNDLYLLSIAATVRLRVVLVLG